MWQSTKPLCCRDWRLPPPAMQSDASLEPACTFLSLNEILTLAFALRISRNFASIQSFDPLQPQNVIAATFNHISVWQKLYARRMHSFPSQRSFHAAHTHCRGGTSPRVPPANTTLAHLLSPSYQAVAIGVCAHPVIAEWRSNGVLLVSPERSEDNSDFAERKTRRGLASVNFFTTR